jgi:hypothetical protein
MRLRRRNQREGTTRLERESGCFLVDHYRAPRPTPPRHICPTEFITVNGGIDAHRACREPIRAVEGCTAGSLCES